MNTVNGALITNTCGTGLVFDAVNKVCASSGSVSGYCGSNCNFIF